MRTASGLHHDAIQDPLGFVANTSDSDVAGKSADGDIDNLFHGICFRLASDLGAPDL